LRFHARLYGPRDGLCEGSESIYNPWMKILLNGRDYEVPAGTTIAGLVKLREIKTPAYAVERNAQVVFRKEHDATRLNEGDKVEIVVAVGGG
jgi:sulfur carrier protein